MYKRIIVIMYIGLLFLLLNGCRPLYMVHVRGEDPFNPIFYFEKNQKIAGCTINSYENGEWTRDEKWGFALATKSQIKIKEFQYSRTPSGYRETTRAFALQPYVLYQNYCRMIDHGFASTNFMIVEKNGQYIIEHGTRYGEEIYFKK